MAASSSSRRSSASSAGDSGTPRGIDRRRFLRYVGAGSAAIFVGCTSSPQSATPATGLGEAAATGATPGAGPWVLADGSATWRSPAYPVPLPGAPWPVAEDAQRLARYEVIDDLVLPDGFRSHVVARYGDVFGPTGATERRIVFGFNNDYTGLLPIDGSDDEFWLFVNHEYVSARPWLACYDNVFGKPAPGYELAADSHDPPLFAQGVLSIDGFSLADVEAAEGNRLNVANEEAWKALPTNVRATIRDTAEKILGDVGVSVLHVRRRADDTFEVIADSARHRRITAYSRINIDGAPHEHSRFSGPSRHLFDSPPRGTMTNCSGGTSPWGTFLTCEENFYNEVWEDVSPGGRPLDAKPRWYGAKGDRINGIYIFDQPTPPNIFGNGHMLDEPLDGREYGWVTEVEPETGHMVKHTALGRFRHENVALRCEAGRPLAAYMGDDRRGGHVWKFVSDEVVEDPSDPATSRLLEKGTLYAAHFRPDFTGTWVPLVPETPLRRPDPHQCPTQHIQVPSRFVGGGVAVGDTERDNPDIEVERWISIVERFGGKPFDQLTLGDLVQLDDDALDSARRREEVQGVLLMDAFLMANACGGTPSARPEDLEVHPHDGSVYIAFTDATGSSDGSPDMRIFPDSTFENSRQYGAIYRIIEEGVESRESDPAATEFTWGRFVSSGEVAEAGGGFACADNMVFDPAGNLWMVTDISTSAQNFPTTREVIDGTRPGGKFFPGVFGNNSMFMIPTDGPKAGVPQLFATAPMEAELCGPTFTDDGRTLILSVQHPGEDDGTRRSENPQDEQVHIVHDRDNRPFPQTRTVPVGSNFPDGRLDVPPRPAVVAIVRDDEKEA
ncbi:MAG: alkaline phosphatase PhoX [Acidobacteriota bacterium]